MAQIAGLSDLRKHGAPADIGTFQMATTALVFQFTFSGVTYTVAMASGVSGWTLISNLPVGTDDVVINAAIAYVGALGGGLVHVCANIIAGVTYYDLTAEIVDGGHDDIILEGEGWNTVFRLADDSDCHVVTLAAGNNWILRNFKIDGNSAGQTQADEGFMGIHTYIVNHLLVERIETTNTGGAGIYIGGDGTDVTVDSCYVHACVVWYLNGGGIHLGTTDRDLDTFIVRGCLVEGNLHGVGIKLYTSGTGTIRNGEVHNNILMPSVYTDNQKREFAVEGVVQDVSIHDNIIKAGYDTTNSCWGIRVDTTGGKLSIQDNIIIGQVIQTREGIFINDDTLVYCKVSGNTIFMFSSGIYIYTAAINMDVSDNWIYGQGAFGIRADGIASVIERNYINGRGSGEVGTRGVITETGSDENIVKNNYIKNVEVGIEVQANSDNNVVKENQFSTVGTCITDGGTGTILPTREIQLIQGTTFISTADEAWGWQINADTNFALGIGWLPLEVQQVVRIRVIGVALAAPGAGDYMRIQITGEGATFDEVFTTEPIDVVDHNNEEVNVAIDDVVNWIFDATDDADIGDLLGGDRLQIKVLHEGAGNGDAETNAIVDSIQVEYV